MIATERHAASLPSHHAARSAGRATLLFATTCVALAASACAELPTETDPVPAEAELVGDSTLANAILVGTSLYTGEYAWSRGNLAMPMGSTSGRVCFLTRIGGSFQKKGDWVGVVASGGKWYLTGASATGHVYAGARCISTAYYSSEYHVIGANAVTGRATLPTRACGLTRAGGTFNGGFDGVRIHDDRTITAHSEFGWVEGAARCAGGVIIASGLEYYWGYSSAPIPMQPSTGQLCVLSAMIGVFETSADVFQTYISRGYWYLSGSKTHGSDIAAGRCMRKNPRLR
jgi:hypothetical protein